MKKTIIALAVASAASLGSVAQADNTTLYGSVRMSVENTNMRGNGFSNTGTVVRNNASRFGIRGSDDLGNGLSANYNLELGQNQGGVTSRLINVGLSGDFGAITLGRQNLAYYDVVSAADTFNAVGFAGYLYNGGGTRGSNMVKYETPDMGGFKGTIELTANGNSGAGADKDNLDIFSIAAQYANNGITAGLAYTKFRNTANDAAILGGSIGYSTDQFGVAFSAERGYNYQGIWGGATNSWSKRATPGAYTGVSGSNPYHLVLAGNYNIDESNILRASVGHTRLRNSARAAGIGIAAQSADVKLTEFALGYQHNFSARTRVWAEYEYVKFGDAAGGNPKSSTISLGLRSDF